MLAALGLSADEEALYRLLVGRAMATAPDLAALTGFAEHDVAAALARLVACGLATHTNQDGFAAAPPAVALGSLITERREALRTAELALADADLGLVPLTVSSGGDPGAVLLHRSGLLAAVQALFEMVWRASYPLTLSDVDGVVEDAAEGLTGLDQKILALLLSGLTDQAVAAQLDLSLRTLQRRLRYLMDLAAVQSRMQLGWHAARQSWA